jgi:hypothetical protein
MQKFLAAVTKRAPKGLALPQAWNAGDASPRKSINQHTSTGPAHNKKHIIPPQQCVNMREKA